MHRIINFDSYKLKGKARKVGFQRWRYVFSGYHSETGDKAFFFIELNIVNPLLSPEKVQCSEVNKLDFSLDTSIPILPIEPPAPHSYVAVKVGVFTDVDVVSFEKKYPTKDFVFTKKEIKVGNAFFYNGSILKGDMLTPKGVFTWNLNIEKKASFNPKKTGKGTYLAVSGARTLFSGEIIYKASSYVITPAVSYGYIDSNWGKGFPVPFFHMSCSHLRSDITGMTLPESSFVVQGMNRGSFSLFTEISLGLDSLIISIPKTSKKSSFDCVVSDDNIHWTVSASQGKYLIDIDVFCDVKKMFVRKYSCPESSVEQMQVLAGTSGKGEIRIYQKAKKNLELIEHATLEDVCCEYGAIENTLTDS